MNAYHVFSAPLHVFLSITNQCNLNCIHCFQSSGKKLANELTFLEIKKLIDSFSKLRVFSVVLTGGEPLLRSDIFPLLKYFRKNRIKVIINTNGTLLTKKNVERLLDCGVNNLGVSLDGSKPEINDFIRGNGVFDKVTKNIKIAIDYGVKVGIGIVVMKCNRKDIPSLLSLARRLGVSGVEINRLHLLGRAALNASILRLSRHEFISLVHQLKKIKRIYGDFVKINFSLWDHLIDVKLKSKKNPQRPATLMSKCQAGKTFCAITCDGYVLPCNLLNLRCGNIREQELGEIWNSSLVLQRFRNLSKLAVSQTNWKCKECPYNMYCDGGCRAAAYSAFNDLTAPDPRCWYDPTIRNRS